MRKLVVSCAALVMLALGAAPAGATTYAASSNPAGAYVSFTASFKVDTSNGSVTMTTNFTLKDTAADGQCAHVHISADVNAAPDPSTDFHVCGNGSVLKNAWSASAQGLLGVKYTVCRWQPGTYQPGCGTIEAKF